MKTCSSCKALKPLDSFHKQPTKKDGLHTYCKDCLREANKKNHDPSRHRDRQLLKRYNLSLKEWNEMFDSQGKQCKICTTKILKGRGWQTDHDHATGKVRGILCFNCNALLGNAHDSPEILTEAIKYLQQYE